VWREIDLPMAARAAGIAAGFAFAVSLGEFGATVFIARPDSPTLPVAVARLLGRAGEMNYGQAMALSTVLMAVCAVCLLILEVPLSSQAATRTPAVPGDPAPDSGTTAAPRTAPTREEALR